MNHVNPDPDALLSDKALAALLGVHRSTVWRWTEDGTLPRPMRIGGATRWPRGEALAAVRRASMREAS